MIKGLVVSGSSGKVLIRQKSDQDFELGELLVADQGNTKVLLQVFELFHSSQISQQNLELISGLQLEENNNLEFMDPELRNYTMAFAKPVLTTDQHGSRTCKTLPPFFSTVRGLEKDDLVFLPKPEDALVIGRLRSGSKLLDFDVSLPGRDLFSHHILISGTTGRGKSVLIKDLLWDAAGKDFCGVLVLDPHDEYFGRNRLGLKDHPGKSVVYYTPKDPLPGSKTLKVNLRVLRPQHFSGVADFSDPQIQALNMFYREFGSNWISAIVKERKLQSAVFREETLVVVRRRILHLLNLELKQDDIVCNGFFDCVAGESTVSDVCDELEHSKTVIIDTSHFSGSVELLLGSLLAGEVYARYRFFKSQGSLQSKPVVSIVLEEAPRVLGKDVLEKGSNIFATIAREGRKFKVGLTAITQLPSLIPRQILANMNTKIILGTEMRPERQAIIESASQDLSDDDRNIASLDKGEAIVSSSLAKFAFPVKVPFFDDLVKKSQDFVKKDFSGVGIDDRV